MSNGSGTFKGLGFQRMSAANPEFIKMLVYGFPGSGKTTLVATLLSAGYSVALCDFDRGRLSLNRWLTPESRVMHKEYRTWEEFQSDINRMRFSGPLPNTVLVVDTVTKGLSALEQEMNGDWKHTSSAAQAVITKLFDMPLNVLCLAWAKSQKGKVVGRNGKSTLEEIGWVPDLIPSVINTFTGLFDFVGFIKQEALDPGGRRRKSSRNIWWDGGDQFVAKDRMNILSNPSQPDLGAIFRIIQGKDLPPADEPEKPPIDMGPENWDGSGVEINGELPLPPMAHAEPTEMPD